MTNFTRLIKKHGYFACLFIFSFLLTIGCFWQILNVCQLYFDYPTNVFIETKFDSLNYSMPALTFCGDTKEPSFGKNSSDIFQNELAKFKYQMFIGYIILKWPKDGIGIGHGEYKDKIYLPHAIERISLERYCITLNSVLSGLNSTELKSREKLEISMQISSKFMKRKKWLLFLHDSYSMPVSTEWNYIEVLAGYFHAITWKLVSYNLLESPYPTHCKNYRLTTEYQSRKDCVRKCKINVSLTNCNVIYEAIDIQNDDKMSVRFGKKGFKCVDDLESICNKRCPNYDCHINHYTPVLLLRPPRPKNDTMINIFPPTVPEKVYTHEPRIRIVELLCNIGSTISMWFGLSFYSFYYLFSVCRNHLNKPDHKPGIKINKSRTQAFKKRPTLHQLGW